jgi:hypothetical protein
MVLIAPSNECAVGEGESPAVHEEYVVFPIPTSLGMGIIILVVLHGT